MDISEHSIRKFRFRVETAPWKEQVVDGEMAGWTDGDKS